MTSDESTLQSATAATDDAVSRATYDELKRELDALKAQLAGAGAESAETPPERPEDLTPQQALAALQENPVTFIHALIQDAASRYLLDMRDQAELDGAVRAFSRQRPEFNRFAPYVIQEALTIMQNDDDGVIAPWHELLEQGYRAFEKKFQDAVKNNPSLTSDAPPTSSPGAFVEGRANREPTPEPPSFTRAEIARMSLADFLKNEAAIDEALKRQRIR